jgi:hypothetical protein
MLTCPVDGCLYVQCGGTLFDHVFTKHDEEELALAIVRLMTPKEHPQ